MAYPLDVYTLNGLPPIPLSISRLSRGLRLRAERETTLASNEMAGAYHVCVSPNHTKDSTDCAAMRRRERTCAPRAG
jgi:hypothetical protein